MAVNVARISQLTAKGSNLDVTDLFAVSVVDGSSPSGYTTYHLTGQEVLNMVAGDMLKSVYDPTTISADCFDIGNHYGIEQIKSIITANLTGDVDNWSPTGFATANMIRILPDADNWEISGLPAPASPISRIVHFSNTHPTYDIKFMDDNSSISANGILLRDSTDKSIQGNECASFWYDHLAGKWKVFNRVG